MTDSDRQTTARDFRTRRMRLRRMRLQKAAWRFCLILLAILHGPLLVFRHVRQDLWRLWYWGGLDE